MERQSTEVRLKVAFLSDATDRGFRSYATPNDDCGAVADDGRECLIVWRGQQRAELLLIDPGAEVSKKLFAARGESAAFLQASAAALAWLSGEALSSA